MGNCSSRKVRSPGKNKKKAKNIPLDSPLGKLLSDWDNLEITKGLDKIRMVRYCRKVWPEINIQGEWPWYGTQDGWLCTQLHQYICIQGDVDAEQIQYITCWLKYASEEEDTKVYKLKEKKQDSERKEKEGTKEANKNWDPLENLPPPTFAVPQIPPPIPPTVDPTTPPLPAMSSLLPPLPPTIPLPPPTQPYLHHFPLSQLPFLYHPLTQSYLYYLLPKHLFTCHPYAHPRSHDKPLICLSDSMRLVSVLGCSVG